MVRLLYMACISAIFAGCATPSVGISPNPNWTRVSGEEAKCTSYAPRRDEAVDINIILKPEFERELVAQLDDAERKAPRCWYETPAGAIRLFAGEFCVGGVDAAFEQQGSAW